MRLSDASSMFLEEKAQEGFSPYTVHAYRLQHELLIRDIGDVEVGQVTLQLLRAHFEPPQSSETGECGSQNPRNQEFV